jgi:hypothetical protein
MDQLFIVPFAVSRRTISADTAGEGEGEQGASGYGHYLVCESLSLLFESCREALWELFQLSIDVKLDQMSRLDESVARLRARIGAIKVHAGDSTSTETLLMHLQSVLVGSA